MHINMLESVKMHGSQFTIATKPKLYWWLNLCISILVHTAPLIKLVFLFMSMHLQHFAQKKSTGRGCGELHLPLVGMNGGEDE